MTLDDIKREIEKANSIVILTHESPDGDAVGSSIAMSLALEKIGKKSDVIIPEYSRVFSFLPGVEKIKKEGKAEYDLAIALDCGNKDRLDKQTEYFDNAITTIAIDHHTKNTMFADYNYVDHTSPACSQILVIVFNYLGIEIDKNIGTCLLTGIITDTGGFQYSGVNVETFEFASELLTSGINVSEIYKKVLTTKTRANYELTKIAIDRMEFLENGKITFTYITNEDELKTGAEEGDHEGIVNIGRDVEGVEVSIFLHQSEDEAFKISLRSNEYVNVADVSLMFGGGGHVRAAGCKLKGTPQEIKNRLVTEIKEYLK